MVEDMLTVCLSAKHRVLLLSKKLQAGTGLDVQRYRDDSSPAIRSETGGVPLEEY